MDILAYEQMSSFCTYVCMQDYEYLIVYNKL